MAFLQGQLCQSTLITAMRTKQANKIFICSPSFYILLTKRTSRPGEGSNFHELLISFPHFLGLWSFWVLLLQKLPPLWKVPPPYPAPLPCTYLAVFCFCILEFDIHEHVWAVFTHTLIHKHDVGCVIGSQRRFVWNGLPEPSVTRWRPSSPMLSLLSERKQQGAGQNLTDLCPCFFLTLTMHRD